MKLPPDLQARDPSESDLKIRRRRHRDIFFASSYPLLIGLAVFWNHLSSVDGGSAIGGKVANGQYYVANDSGLFNNVGLFRWSLNLIAFALPKRIGRHGRNGLLPFCIFLYSIHKSKAKPEQIVRASIQAAFFKMSE